MGSMTTIVLSLLATGLAAAVVYLWTRLRTTGNGSGSADREARLAAAVEQAVTSVSAELQARAAGERDAAIRAALEHGALMQQAQFEQVTARQREQLGAKEELIGSRLDEVRRDVRDELERLGHKVGELGRSNAERFGEFDQALRSHAEVAATLADSTRSLREALSSTQMRGQWGERMAEDVLRLAGFVENVNYRKQAQLDGGTGRPDFTFELPKGHVLYMDVKFPLAAYLRYLEAGTEAERAAHLKRFLTDVRQRVKELAVRDYAGAGEARSVDYVLLFLPNEQLTGFIYEHDPALLDDAMGQRVVLCSPLTLFAFLGIIRQAFDNFMIEQTSDEILQLMATFSSQWEKYNTTIDKAKRQLDTVEKTFDELAGPRRRQLSKPLEELTELRRRRGLAGPDELLELGQLDLDDDDDGNGDDDDSTPPGVESARLRRLGA